MINPSNWTFQPVLSKGDSPRDVRRAFQELNTQISMLSTRFLAAVSHLIVIDAGGTAYQYVTHTDAMLVLNDDGDPIRTAWGTAVSGSGLTDADMIRIALIYG